MDTQIDIRRRFDECPRPARPTGAMALLAPPAAAAEHARLRERYAGRLDARAVQEAVAVRPPRAVASQVDGATRLRTAAAPGADDLALWYIPFLAATLLALLAVDALCIRALIR